MSDKKISQLAASTTPLAGTEVLPIVQGGATTKVSVDNLTAGRVTSVSRVVATGSLGTPSSNAQFGWVASQGAVIAGIGTSYDVLLQNKTNQSVLGIVTGTRDAEMTAGNLRFSAGKGIDFSADGQAAGMTSELLDDYEEGTWTPSVGGDATYTAQSGKYIRVGNAVSINGRLKINVLGTGSTFLITGLPFTSSNDGIGSSVHIGVWANLATIPVYASGYVYPNFAGIELQGTLTGTATLAALGILSNSTEIYFSGTYFV